jgi:hypothetical protein
VKYASGTELLLFRAKNRYSIERRLMDYVPTAFYGAVVVVSPDAIRAKNSYSIERRLMDYVPTAFYGAVVVVSPDARAASSSNLS